MIITIISGIFQFTDTALKCCLTNPMLFIHFTEAFIIGSLLFCKFLGMLLLHLLDDAVGKRIAQGCRAFTCNEQHYFF